MKRKLSLEELELELPKIETRETRFLLGGTGYTVVDGGLPPLDGIDADERPDEDDISTIEPDGPVDTDNSDPTGGDTATEDDIPDGGGDQTNDGGYQDESDNSDQDGYGDQDQDGYGDQDQDGYGDQDSDRPNDGGNSGNTGVPEIPENLTDGVNTNNFIFNTSAGSSAFNQQLEGILQSNSVIANLLGFFNNGVVQMTFDVQHINSPAHMEAVTSESYHIRFDPDYIDENGLININGTDNVGYNHTGLTGMESLAVILAHEAMHAKHRAVWDAALRGEGSIEGARGWLLSQNYSQDFVNIFSVGVTDAFGNTTYAINSNSSQAMHDYMEQYNHGVFDAALEEFRNDVQSMQSHQSTLENGLRSAETQLHNTHGDIEQGYDHFRSLVDSIRSELREFEEEYQIFLN